MIRFFFHLFKLIFTTVFFVVLLCALVFFYAYKIEPQRLKIKEFDCPSELSEEFRVVQLSDIQISKTCTLDTLSHVVDAVNAQSPDLVLFTGDLYENYAQYHCDSELISLLSSIQADYKFAIWGNRDYGGGASRHYKSIMNQSGFQVLCNESTKITTNFGETIAVGGIDDALLGNPEPISMPKSTLSLLMIHEPDLADQYTDLDVSFILSGHSHGGQVRLPFFPSVTTSMAKKYTKGFYSLTEECTLFVNTGIGTSRYPLRLGVPPEIAVFSFF